MKKLLIIFPLIFLLGCQQAQAPKVGNLVIDGTISKGVKSYGSPYFYGYVKNTGNNTVYNGSITFTIYSDSTKTTIKDTGWDYLASGEDIAPGVRAPFEAIFFALSATDSTAYYDYKFSWLER